MEKAAACCATELPPSASMSTSSSSSSSSPLAQRPLPSSSLSLLAFAAAAPSPSPPYLSFLCFVRSSRSVALLPLGGWVGASSSLSTTAWLACCGFFLLPPSFSLSSTLEAASSFPPPSEATSGASKCACAVRHCGKKRMKEGPFTHSLHTTQSGPAAVVAGFASSLPHSRTFVSLSTAFLPSSSALLLAVATNQS